MPAPERTAAATSEEGLDLLLEWPRFQELAHAVSAGGEVHAGSLWGSSQALVLAGLTRCAQGPWLALTSTHAEAEALTCDLDAFGTEALLLPARGGDESARNVDADAVRERLRLAQALAGPPERRPRLVVTSLLALIQPLPSPGQLDDRFLTLQRGSTLDLEGLLGRLVEAGYSREPLAERPGEVSLRGDVLDVYGFADESPLRIELFDDLIESLRCFDPDSQRSIERLDRAAVCLAADPGGVEDGQGVAPISLFAPSAVVVTVEPLRCEEQRVGLRVRSTSHSRALEDLAAELRGRTRVELQSLPSGAYDFDARSVQGLAVGLHAAPSALEKELRTTSRIQVFCRAEGERARLAELLGRHPELEDVELALGSLTKGFRLPELGWLALNHHELAGVTGPGRSRLGKRTSHKVRALESFFELRVGDLVVHAVHGLARYRGLSRMERGGGEEDHLHLEFEDEVSLFVPACRVDLVQRYVGTGKAAPRLDKLNSGAFRKRKDKVEKALLDLAGELLEVQAARELNRREPWRAEPELVGEMLEAFPYEDTPDQRTASEEIARDLEGEHPMDRLLCGDVGFGKTEVAIRAAFRVVAAGAQVAVLVPTTLLAEQHLATFRQRLTGLGVEVRDLSRLNTPKEAKQTIADVAAGRVDILIGTHRILSKDVHFARLGLVVIDEEQRFGVKHKEHFKAFRAQVDVLTLSATPIPRTLHMSLSGVRDISALSQPPPGRQDIETHIANRDDLDLVRDVLRREKLRGGQVFFLHNRVDDLPSFTAGLEQLVPECSFAYGHGQMAARELERVMRRFTAGEVDVLVSTTIVENGIDIPAAGTILIDEADRFGLAELHQLRGRVGRGQQRAWCYLLIDRTRPMRQVARERLKALEELSHLGAGFQISMKDLELRGAGNLLGPEQSGHIAAIGYDMYCRLLAQTVERLKSGSLPSIGLPSAAAEGGDRLNREAVELELGLRAYLPAEWIASADERLELLRKLDGVATEADADALADELGDRYGRVPPEALSLLRQFRLRAALRRLTVTRLAWRSDSYLVEFTDRVALESGLRASPHAGDLDLRPLRTGVALVMVPPHVESASQGITWLEDALQVPAPTSKMGT